MAEFVDPGLPAVADLHRMALALQDFLDELAQQRLVVDAKDTQLRNRLVAGIIQALVLAGPHREREMKRRAGTRRGCNIDASFVALDNAVNHGQSQSRAALALGG